MKEDMLELGDILINPDESGFWFFVPSRYLWDHFNEILNGGINDES